MSRNRRSYTYICQYCGNEYHPKETDRNKYCSRECYFAGKRDQKIFNTEYRKSLRQQNKRIPLSHERIKELKRLKAFEKAKCEYRPHEVICKQCGKSFKTEYGNKKRGFCSARCAKKYNKVQRRARRKDAFIEPVGIAYLIKRDKGICQICGEPTSNQYDSGDLFSPTIDHILPYTKGGKHQRTNAQLAHLICNSIKNDYILP